MTHHCHALNCDQPVAPRLFMCRDHWARLPDEHKKAIHKTYRKGQERTKTPSRDYVIAANKAVIAMAESEGLGESKRLNLARKCLEMFEASSKEVA